MLKQPRFQWTFWPVLALLCACASPANTQPVTTEATSIATEAGATIMPEIASLVADVLSIQVSGAPGAYTFAVEIASPDKNCSQYADWWEVIDEEGQLLYRRVLTHSHADEQPFTRSGGPVPVEPGTTVWIRAHMNVGGYGGAALHGSVQDGFNQAELGADFAADLAKLPPLPQDCAF
jgi:hypothetical protein